MVTPNSILEGCKKSILTVHVPDYLVNTYKYTYDEAFSLVVGSNTYHRLLTSTLYLNQDPLYVLDDFKSEVMPRIS